MVTGVLVWFYFIPCVVITMFCFSFFCSVSVVFPGLFNFFFRVSRIFRILFEDMGVLLVAVF